MHLVAYPPAGLVLIFFVVQHRSNAVSVFCAWRPPPTEVIGGARLAVLLDLFLPFKLQIRIVVSEMDASVLVDPHQCPWVCVIYH